MTQVEPFKEQRSEFLLGEVRETYPQSLREDPSGVLGQLERDQESPLGRKPSKHIQLMLVAFVADELHLELTPGPGLRSWNEFMRRTTRWQVAWAGLVRSLRRLRESPSAPLLAVSLRLDSETD